MSFDTNIQNAQTTIDQLGAMANSATGEAKSQFSQYGSQIQSLLNNFLTGYGVLKQEQVDQLDFQVRQAKIAMLDYQSKKTVRTYATIAVVTFFVLIAAGIIVKKTNKK